MGIFDAIELVAGALDYSRYWRVLLTTGGGIGMALGLYYVSGESPASAAVAFAISTTFFCAGLMWHAARGRRPGG